MAPQSLSFLNERYRGVPHWIVVPQVFLAIGWGRAALAHAVEPDWWTGEGVRLMLVEIEEQRLPGIGALLHWIGDATAPVAAPVLVGLQALVAVLLLLNLRPLTALAIGAGMNLHFMVAGAVNPSIFYLVLATVIGSWLLEQRLSPAAMGAAARAAAGVSALTILVLLPLTRTLDPAHVIEDPALVLSSYAGLLVMVAALMVDGSDPASDDAGADDRPVDLYEFISSY